MNLGWTPDGEAFEIRQVQYGKPDALGRQEAVDVVTRLPLADAREVLRFLVAYLPDQEKKAAERQTKAADHSAVIARLQAELDALKAARPLAG